MYSSLSEHDLESIVKVEVERFEDDVVKDWSENMPKSFVHVYDALKPFVRLKRLDAKTIANWTRTKTRKKKVIEFPKQKIGRNYFSCDLCPNWFQAKSSLRKHMWHHRRLNDSTITKGKTCPVCNKKVEAKNFSQHLGNHKQVLKKKSCPTCGLEISMNHFDRHVSSHKRFRCRECKIILTSMPELREHLSSVHYDGKGHECSFCGNVYRTKLNLRSHENGVHIKRKNLCEICGQEFESYIKKFRHWRAEHYETHGNHGQWRRQNGSITKVLSSSGPYICDICGQVFEFRYLICSHLKARHGPKKVFSCDFCGETKNLKTIMKNHILSTHISHDFECDICQKKFSAKCYLRQHIGTHNKAAECKICHKLVTNMKSHIGTMHIYKKMIACTICRKVIDKSSMKKHLKGVHGRKYE